MSQIVRFLLWFKNISFFKEHSWMFDIKPYQSGKSDSLMNDDIA